MRCKKCNAAQPPETGHNTCPEFQGTKFSECPGDGKIRRHPALFQANPARGLRCKRNCNATKTTMQNKTATQKNCDAKDNVAQTITCYLVAVVSKHHTQAPFPPSANLKGSEMQKKLQCNKKQKRKTQMQCKNICNAKATAISWPPCSPNITPKTPPP